MGKSLSARKTVVANIKPIIKAEDDVFAAANVRI